MKLLEAWKVIAQLQHQPVALVLTRQALPTFDRTKYGAASGTAKGAYILADAPGGKPEVILMGTGSEVSLCVRPTKSSRQKALRRAWSACHRGISLSARMRLTKKACCRFGDSASFGGDGGHFWLGAICWTEGANRSGCTGSALRLR